jgi:hypothetical protein
MNSMKHTNEDVLRAKQQIDFTYILCTRKPNFGSANINRLVNNCMSGKPFSRVTHTLEECRQMTGATLAEACLTRGACWLAPVAVGGKQTNK